MTTDRIAERKPYIYNNNICTRALIKEEKKLVRGETVYERKKPAVWCKKKRKGEMLKELEKVTKEKW